MLEWVPLVVAVLVSGATVGTVAIILRTPARLTDVRSRVAELEARLATAEGNVRKALRRAGQASKQAPPPQEVDDDIAAYFPGGNGGPPTSPRSMTLEDVQREIARRGAL